MDRTHATGSSSSMTAIFYKNRTQLQPSKSTRWKVAIGLSLVSKCSASFFQQSSCFTLLISAAVLSSFSQLVGPKCRVTSLWKMLHNNTFIVFSPLLLLPPLLHHLLQHLFFYLFFFCPSYYYYSVAMVAIVNSQLHQLSTRQRIELCKLVEIQFDDVNQLNWLVSLERRLVPV